jgi:hypothetical protein
MITTQKVNKYNIGARCIVPTEKMGNNIERAQFNYNQQI